MAPGPGVFPQSINVEAHMTDCITNKETFLTSVHPLQQRKQSEVWILITLLGHDAVLVYPDEGDMIDG